MIEQCARNSIFAQMKNAFFLAFLIALLATACRSDDEQVQRVDQIIQLYIDSAKTDMLNPDIEGTYTNIRMNDVYGLTDNAPVNFTLKKDADTLNYIEYVAGARRILIDSTASLKIYESKIALLLTKKLTDSTNVIVNDTLTLKYNSTAELFQINEVYYNYILKFRKTEGADNVVKVSK